MERILSGVTLLGTTAIPLCSKLQSRTWATVFECFAAISSKRGSSKRDTVEGPIFVASLQGKGYLQCVLVSKKLLLTHLH